MQSTLNFATNVPPAPSFAASSSTNGAVSFTWNAVAGQAYQVQYKTNLTQSPWINLGSPILATNGLIHLTDVPTPGPQRFYRVVLLE